MSTDIIISHYNYFQYIDDCVHSCLEQEDVNIIVVDDVSDQMDFTNRPWTNDSRTMLMSHTVNQGVSAARNTGLKSSRAEFVQILDADDMLVPGSIKLRAKYLKDHPELDLVYGTTVELKNGKFSSHKSELATHSILFRRRVFEKFGLFYEPLRTKEDKEFKYRIGLHRQSFQKGLVKYKKINKPVAVYRRHEGAKRKLRSRDINLEIQTQMIFDSRVKEIEREGITPKNTVML